jgi:hypothetical protein
MAAAQVEQAGGQFHADGIECGRVEEIESDPEAAIRVDHMVVETIDDHRAVVGRRQHECDFAALMFCHQSHAQPEQCEVRTSAGPFAEVAMTPRVLESGVAFQSACRRAPIRPRAVQARTREIILELDHFAVYRAWIVDFAPSFLAYPVATHSH